MDYKYIKHKTVAYNGIYFMHPTGVAVAVKG
jgi:hypothetical protein